ncbi:MAG: VWA domain-containing protein [Planctomycetota bacterium]
MVAGVLAALAAVLVALGEGLHALRTRRLSYLAFGPSARPRPWTHAAPSLRVLAAAGVAWGLATLLALPPQVHSADSDPEHELPPEHLVLVLDVSPSMRLEDAGLERDTSRLGRAREVVESLFRRVPLTRFRVSVVATYSGAKAVVVDTRDLEVVRNILSGLPMHHAFQSGKTKLFAGLEEAARIAHPWTPRSAVVVLISDGDTVPAQGMPKLPASVRDLLVVGVGDPHQGSFVSGRLSRQDVPTLRQIAARLGGVYHDGNTRHLSSDTLGSLLPARSRSVWERLTRREYALLATLLGALVLALLPAALRRWGSEALGVSQTRLDPLP